MNQEHVFLIVLLFTKCVDMFAFTCVCVCVCLCVSVCVRERENS